MRLTRKKKERNQEKNWHWLKGHRSLESEGQVNSFNGLVFIWESAVQIGEVTCPIAHLDNLRRTF